MKKVLIYVAALTISLAISFVVLMAIKDVKRSTIEPYRVIDKYDDCIDGIFIESNRTLIIITADDYDRIEHYKIYTFFPAVYINKYIVYFDDGTSKEYRATENVSVKLFQEGDVCE